MTVKPVRQKQASRVKSHGKMIAPHRPPPHRPGLLALPGPHREGSWCFVMSPQGVPRHGRGHVANFTRRSQARPEADRGQEPQHRLAVTVIAVRQKLVLLRNCRFSSSDPISAGCVRAAFWRWLFILSLYCLLLLIRPNFNPGRFALSHPLPTHITPLASKVLDLQRQIRCGNVRQERAVVCLSAVQQCSCGHHRCLQGARSEQGDSAESRSRPRPR